jgi:protein-L-isoaspartate(D-aspartate) O-methyltransferase
LSSKIRQVGYIPVPKNFLENIQRRVQAVNLTISDSVFAAFKKVPREYFVREGDKNNAYIDSPLAIDAGQTISAPHMYAMMLAQELLNPLENMSVLEIGSGSGYGAALLGKIVYPGKVISIERHESLVGFAKQNLLKLGLENVDIRLGDGTLGCPGQKFDRIIVTATGPK